MPSDPSSSNSPQSSFFSNCRNVNIYDSKFTTVTGNMTVIDHSSSTYTMGSYNNIGNTTTNSNNDNSRVSGVPPPAFNGYKTSRSAQSGVYPNHSYQPLAAVFTPQQGPVSQFTQDSFNKEREDTQDSFNNNSFKRFPTAPSRQAGDKAQKTRAAPTDSHEAEDGSESEPHETVREPKAKQHPAKRRRKDPPPSSHPQPIHVGQATRIDPMASSVDEKFAPFMSSQQRRDFKTMFKHSASLRGTPPSQHPVLKKETATSSEDDSITESEEESEQEEITEGVQSISLEEPKPSRRPSNTRAQHVSGVNNRVNGPFPSSRPSPVAPDSDMADPDLEQTPTSEHPQFNTPPPVAEVAKGDHTLYDYSVRQVVVNSYNQKNNVTKDSYNDNSVKLY